MAFPKWTYHLHTHRHTKPQQIVGTGSKDANLYRSQLDHLPGSVCVCVWGGGGGGGGYIIRNREVIEHTIKLRMERWKMQLS